MTTQVRRAKWTTYNTWPQDRRKAKRSARKAREHLAQLIAQAPAALAAAQNRRSVMTERDTDYWSVEAMEARQAARRALIERCGPPARRERPIAPPRPLSERERLLNDGFIFTVARQSRERTDAEHRALRRRADAERESRQRLFEHLRDLEGSDAAEAWMNGDDAA